MLGLRNSSQVLQKICKCPGTQYSFWYVWYVFCFDAIVCLIINTLWNWIRTPRIGSKSNLETSKALRKSVGTSAAHTVSGWRVPAVCVSRWLQAECKPWPEWTKQTSNVRRRVYTEWKCFHAQVLKDRCHINKSKWTIRRQSWLGIAMFDTSSQGYLTCFVLEGLEEANWGMVWWIMSRHVDMTWPVTIVANHCLSRLTNPQMYKTN